MPGLHDLLEQLRQQRQEQLDRYNMADISRTQGEARGVLKTEREGIEKRSRRRQRRREVARQRSQMLEKMAARSSEQLDQLPEDPARQSAVSRTTTSWTRTPGSSSRS